MSDVLIKGMRMPSCCGSCDLVFLCSDGMHFCCTRLIGQIFDIELSEQRQEGCPLIKVKEAEVGDLYKVKTSYVTGKKIWMEVEHGLAD